MTKMTDTAAAAAIGAATRELRLPVVRTDAASRTVEVSLKGKNPMGSHVTGSATLVMP